MKLSINENLSIISYAHHGYPNAIIQRDIDRSLLELEINSDDQENWEEKKKYDLLEEVIFWKLSQKNMLLIPNAFI